MDSKKLKSYSSNLIICLQQYLVIICFPLLHSLHEIIQVLQDLKTLKMVCNTYCYEFTTRSVPGLSRI